MAEDKSELDMPENEVDEENEILEDFVLIGGVVKISPDVIDELVA